MHIKSINRSFKSIHPNSWGQGYYLPKAFQHRKKSPYQDPHPKKTKVHHLQQAADSWRVPKIHGEVEVRKQNP
jgi:hypothetical protein